MVRALIVSAEAPFGPSATGLTIGSLFEGWDPQRLAVVTAQPDATPPDRAGAVFRWVPASRFTGWQHKARRWLGSTALESAGGVVVGLGDREETPDAVTFRTRLHETARAARSTGFRAVPPGLLSGAARFQPDVIYSPLGDFTWSHGARMLGEATGAPVVPHFMDDWLRTLFSATYLKGFWDRQLGRAVQRALARSTVGLAISEAMAAEYGPLLGLPFRVFMRCVEDTAAPPPAPRAPGRPLNVVYFGGLHLGRHLVLKAVADALTELSRSGTVVDLHIMAPAGDMRTFSALLAGIPVLRSADSVTPEAGERRLAGADLGLHIESFSARAAAYTRLSVSTKIPSYLRAGLPILAVGPSHLASMDYVADHGVGLVVNTADSSAIASQLRRALSDDAWLARTGRRARDLFLERHEAGAVRTAFAELLQEAAARGSARIER